MTEIKANIFVPLEKFYLGVHGMFLKQSSVQLRRSVHCYTGAPEPRGQLPPPQPLLHGGSAGAEKCPFAM